MTECSAMNCDNSSKKGYVMNVFPHDPEQRAKWAINVGRINWNPTDASHLCEIHFEPTMWEERIDGLRKLKPNAVPTIFGYCLKKQDEGQNISNIHYLQPKAIEKSETMPSTSNSDPSTSSNDMAVINVKENSNQSSEMQLITAVEDFPSTSGQNLIKGDIQIMQVLQREQKKWLNKHQITLNKQKKILKKQTAKIALLRNQLMKSRLFYEILLRKKENVKRLYRKQLKKIFTEDQLYALLMGSNRLQRWSNDTIIKALKLRYICGEDGYAELIRQNIPLPSTATLKMRVQESIRSRLRNNIED